jgi:hypothetical protein
MHVDKFTNLSRTSTMAAAQHAISLEMSEVNTIELISNLDCAHRICREAAAHSRWSNPDRRRRHLIHPTAGPRAV